MTVVTTDVVPVLHVVDATATAAWYERLGFVVQFEHRFGPGFPLYMGLRRDGAQLHLSEHAGDARPDTLVYVWVDHIDSLVAALGGVVEEQPWGREMAVTDPDGNRLRIASPAATGATEVDAVLGSGTMTTLVELEQAMWAVATRGDGGWIDEHLTDDFTEHGRSGRVWTREATIAAEVAAIDIELPLRDLVVRPIGRDGALVTYVSVQPGAVANRASVWRRADGRWRLAFHQGTPTA